MNFADLTQAALLGSERQSIQKTKDNGSLEVLMAQLDENQREHALLSSAVLVGLHERIGSLPTSDHAPAPESCAHEDLPFVSDRAGSLLWSLFTNECKVLLPEFLELAVRSKQLVFPEALPALLNWGSNEVELRDQILPVIGKRGHWLAQQNPKWGWVGSEEKEDESIWLVGEVMSRFAFLRRLRQIKPSRARELLVSTWKEETSDDKVRFLSVLKIRLSLEDEPFLETALDDKRKEVRRIAGGLLGNLPESPFTKRMIDRAKPLLKYYSGETGSLIKLKKGKASRIEMSLPSDCDKSMQRDGVEVKPLQGFGEKGWWVVQMLEVVPLSIWTTEWQTTPAKIITASLTGEWTKELFESWTRAAVYQTNAEWAEALFTLSIDGKRFDKFEGLLSVMSTDKRELRISELLKANRADTKDLHGALIAQCRHPWTLEFSRSIIAWLKCTSKDVSSDWQLRNQFKDFAPWLNPLALKEAVDGWPTDSKGWEFWSKGVDEFLALVQLRVNLHGAFSKQN